MTVIQQTVDREVLQAFVNKVNAMVPGAWKLLERRLAEREFSKAAAQRRVPKIVREMINDAPDGARDWADYDRRRVGMWLAALAMGAAFTPDDLEDLVEICNKEVEFTSRMQIDDGTPMLITTSNPKTEMGKAAYALLTFARPQRGGFKVTACRVCGLIMLNSGKTKPRLFCTKAHQDLFGKRAQRARTPKKSKTARRHQ